MQQARGGRQPPSDSCHHRHSLCCGLHVMQITWHRPQLQLPAERLAEMATVPAQEVVGVPWPLIPQLPQDVHDLNLKKPRVGHAHGKLPDIPTSSSFPSSNEHSTGRSDVPAEGLCHIAVLSSSARCTRAHLRGLEVNCAHFNRLPVCVCWVELGNAGI